MEGPLPLLVVASLPLPAVASLPPSEVAPLLLLVEAPSLHAVLMYLSSRDPMSGNGIRRGNEATPNLFTFRGRGNGPRGRIHVQPIARIPSSTPAMANTADGTADREANKETSLPSPLPFRNRNILDKHRLRFQSTQRLSSFFFFKF
ncbi:hypothetical protein K402DRAFT_29995 [Aulographum hederae CBS 113979]|uniref:Secreted protein n=1 Tax=Aulographum hederae CBS 113979 TaxID=1176131 RepID=A0A6G1H5C4_9PEZI|nr:hypothetical protein K402DRAFT_29995 [Aulographum hederae CBS 113979]